LFVDRIHKYPNERTNKREAIPTKKSALLFYFILNLNLEGQATTTQANRWATPTPPPPPPDGPQYTVAMKALLLDYFK
jgi:hypothetical protein